MPVYAAVEGGGTTFVVAIAHDDPTNVVERAEFPTTTPQETIGKCTAWLKTRHYDALGVATFGPVDLRADSPTFGYITSSIRQITRTSHSKDTGTNAKLELVSLYMQDRHVPRALRRSILRYFEYDWSLNKS